MEMHDYTILRTRDSSPIYFTNWCIYRAHQGRSNGRRGLFLPVFDRLCFPVAIEYVDDRMYIINVLYNILHFYNTDTIQGRQKILQ